MRRRAFIRMLGGTAIAASLFARAQERAKSARIGFLAFGSPLPAYDAFPQGLRDLGWVEGRNIVIERRFAAGDGDRLKKFAVELVQLKVDVIVANASAATRAAKDATASVPIVFVNAGDPAGQGFVKSLRYPGGNVTGISFDATPDITGKQLQLLIEVVPKTSRVAVVWNPDGPFLRSYLDVAQRAAAGMRLSVQSLEAQEAAQYEKAFQSAHKNRAQAVVVLSDTVATFHRAQIAALAASHSLPVLYGHREYVASGGLMSYGPSLTDGMLRGAGYVDKILRGAKPADLPVQLPVKYELVINLKTAKTLGLAIPASVLGRADEIIQ